MLSPDTIAKIERMDTARIRSYGDLEVVLLHEAHGALADLITPDLYVVLGNVPHQQIQFPSSHLFDLFLIRAVELFGEGETIRLDDGTRKRWQLIGGLWWFCQKYSDEAFHCGLTESIRQLTEWADQEVRFDFYCSDFDAKVEFLLSRRELIWLAANRAKHSLLRLSAVLGKLDRKLEGTGIPVTPENTIAVLDAANEEARSRLIYHSSYMVELFGNVFVGLNRVISGRLGPNRTVAARDIAMPEGVTSDIFKNLYSRVLSFKRYDEGKRIRPFVPVTSPYLKLRY